jgi:hypothetical protein
LLHSYQKARLFPEITKNATNITKKIFLYADPFVFISNPSSLNCVLGFMGKI